MITISAQSRSNHLVHTMNNICISFIMIKLIVLDVKGLITFTLLLSSHSRKFTYLQYSCRSCPFNTYNLGRGQLHLESLQDELLFDNKECHECPPGAICDGKIKSIDNYFGYKTSPTKLEFLLCPSGYCCASDTIPCDTYNTCAPGRSGILCGSCDNYHKLSFLTNNCIPKGAPCDVKIFSAYVVCYSLVYTMAFIIIVSAADIIAIIKVSFGSHDGFVKGILPHFR